MTPFDAGRAKGQHIAQTYPDEPGVRTPEQMKQMISSELDLLYAPSVTEGKSQKCVEQIEMSREYHWGIMQGLKDG